MLRPYLQDFSARVNHPHINNYGYVSGGIPTLCVGSGSIAGGSSRFFVHRDLPGKGPHLVSHREAQ